MKTVLITGVNGQDGYYLADHLSKTECRIVGTIRCDYTVRSSGAADIHQAVKLVKCDMLSQQSVLNLLHEFRPDEIYNFAAYSSGAGMYKDPVAVGELNGLAVTRLLEAIRISDPKIRFCQASSREIFGIARESPQSERTVVDPRSPYGAAKLYADMMVKIYRQHYGLYACSAILFNHESPRRRLEFVSRKITTAAARIKLGLSDELRIGNLEAKRDWGYAGDYVRAMHLMLQQSKADDFVIATGKVHSVRDFCKYAFEILNLDYKDYLIEDSSTYRPPEPVELIGNSEKAKFYLGWEPEVEFGELVRMMVEADIEMLRHGGDPVLNSL